MENIEAIVKSSGKLLGGQNLKDQVKEFAAYVNISGNKIPFVIGGGPHYNELCSQYEDHFGPSRKVNGLRVTPYSLMYGSEIHNLNGIIDIAKENQNEVKIALEKEGLFAEIVDFNVIHAKPIGNLVDKTTKETVDMGYTGQIIGADITKIYNIIESGKIPIISHIGNYKGNYYNINATPVAGELAFLMKAKNLILLGSNAVYEKDMKTLIPLITSKDFIEEKKADGTFGQDIIVNIDAIVDVFEKNKQYKLNNEFKGIITTLSYIDGKHNSLGLYNEIKGKSCGTVIRL